jgi:hypothetical protein
MLICIRPHSPAYPICTIFRIILCWNPFPFQDHLVLDNSGAVTETPVWYTYLSWHQLAWLYVQHPAQSGIITTTTTIAPQLRAGCWPDLISDSNERTPAATLAGFFLAHALFSGAHASKRRQ